MAEMRHYFLAIDVGTGSSRAALVSATGEIAAFSRKDYPTYTPRPGWVEQDPEVWWQCVKTTVADVIAKTGVEPERISAVCACGQMHGPVPVDGDGNALLPRVQLWNDKRDEDICQSLRQTTDERALLKLAANPIASSWTGFKVAWIREHQEDVYAEARFFLVPKDFINLHLTGVAATDRSEASGTFLLNCRTLDYDDRLLGELRLDKSKFAPVCRCDEVIGHISAKASKETGLAEGTPVVAGGGDFLVSLLGSGITQPGVGSDVTGTSTLISVCSDKPVLDPRVMNLHAAGDGWVPFCLIDAGGECMRWARRTFAPGDASFDDVNRMADEVEPGSGGLVFLPYLTGERIGGRADSRAQFFGITSGHSPGHFHRSVMEGSAFASKRNIDLMRSLGCDFSRIVAAGGGARSELWLRIKAAVYEMPIDVPESVESGVLGCAILAGCGAGAFASPAEGAQRLVKLSGTIEPDPAWVRTYRKVAALFDSLYESSQDCYDIMARL